MTNKGNVSEKQLQDLLQGLKERPQTGEEGEYSFRNIREVLDQAGLLESLIRDRVETQEQQRQNKQRFIFLMAWLPQLRPL